MNNLEPTLPSSPTIRVITGGYPSVRSWAATERATTTPVIPTIEVPQLTLMAAGVQADELKYYPAYGQPETD